VKTILLKMAGPLQSWGTRSHFETRHTDFYPSKSAMIGLLSACLGYKRDRQEDITALNELDFAVRIDRQGNLLRDYHTARKYKPNGDFERTYVTNRYYLEYAVFVVALGHTDTARMDTIEEAVKNPYFQPFMGRRSLPLTADFFLDSSEEGVLDALAAVPWQGHRRGPEPDFVQLPIYADAHM
jgi:CRISPR system Cascade subunit CasD